MPEKIFKLWGGILQKNFMVWSFVIALRSRSTGKNTACTASRETASISRKGKINNQGLFSETGKGVIETINS